ncbi:MAG: hypothetical protein JWO56_1782 [Acidobacteria bacterium]|nr:hypothetical protein [Acidobacteriota bacterium]
MMVRRAISAAAVAAALFLTYEWCVPPYRCNLAKGALSVRTDANAAEFIGEVARAHARETLALLRPLRHDCPRDIDLLMMQAKNEALMAHVDDSIATYRHALTVEKRPEIYLELARTEYAAGRTAEAFDDAERAIRFHPFMIAEITNPILRGEIDRRVLQKQ